MIHTIFEEEDWQKAPHLNWEKVKAVAPAKADDYFEVEVPTDSFIHDIEAVYRKHGLALGLYAGVFAIMPNTGELEEWLGSAFVSLGAYAILSGADVVKAGHGAPKAKPTTCSYGECANCPACQAKD